MERKFPEADWKVWRKLSPVALERFCEKALDDVVGIARGGGDAHARYCQLFKLLRGRDEVIGAVFDDQRRSNAFLQITRAVVEGILTPDEVLLFSDETRAVISFLSGERESD
jgi:hypothetical protein